MRLRSLALVPMLGTALLVPRLAWAGSPHFVSCALTSVSTSQVCVNGKEAGLGDEDQITVELAVTAHCVNPGGNNPKAGNKQTFETGADIPVQNGRALYSICVTPDFDPNCIPPMSLAVDSVVVTDASNGLICTLQ